MKLFLVAQARAVLDGERNLGGAQLDREEAA